MYQVTSVCFSDTAEQVISGGIDNDIKVHSTTAARHSDSHPVSPLQGVATWKFSGVISRDIACLFRKLHGNDFDRFPVMLKTNTVTKSLTGRDCNPVFTETENQVTRVFKQKTSYGSLQTRFFSFEF